MMFTTKAALDETMKSDPFYNPDVPLSGVTFTDEVEKPDPFEQTEAVNPAIPFKNFLAKPDRESVKELASELGRPELIEQLDPERRFKFFSGDWETEMLFRSGKWLCTATNQESGEVKQFKLLNAGENRDTVMSQANKYLAGFNPPWRKLTQEQLLTVARMAPGSPESAIMTYLSYALPDIDEDVSGDPKYQQLCDEIIWFVFENHTPEFDESAREYMRDKLANRPLTWAMARELFAMYKEQQFYARRNPSLLFRNALPEPEPDRSLDDLSDSAIADLRQQTLRLRATGR